MSICVYCIICPIQICLDIRTNKPSNNNALHNGNHKVGCVGKSMIIILPLNEEDVGALKNEEDKSHHNNKNKNEHFLIHRIVKLAVVKENNDVKNCPHNNADDKNKSKRIHKKNVVYIVLGKCMTYSHRNIFYENEYENEEKYKYKMVVYTNVSFIC